MKKLILLFSVSLLFVLSSVGQDIIVKTNGDEIKTEVLEIETDKIKYKKYDFLDGPTRNIEKSDVFMIIYSNGKREKFTTSETRKKKTKTEKNLNLNKKGNYFSMASGYGNSYGGIGLRLQYVTKGSLRFGFHGGVGYFPYMGRDYVLYSGGIQLFFWYNLYLNAQFGHFGAYEVNEYNSNTGYNEYWGTLYGPSLLLGYDFYISEHFGFNLATGFSLDVDYNDEFYWAIDGGIVLRF
jgi:hypothetical protein